MIHKSVPWPMRTIIQCNAQIRFCNGQNLLSVWFAFISHSSFSLSLCSLRCNSIVLQEGCTSAALYGICFSSATANPFWHWLWDVVGGSLLLCRLRSTEACNTWSLNTCVNDSLMKKIIHRSQRQCVCVWQWPCVMCACFPENIRIHWFTSLFGACANAHRQTYITHTQAIIYPLFHICFPCNTIYYSEWHAI